MRVKAGLVPIELSDKRDRCVVHEIFEQRCYEHLGSGFLFCPRQHWLDVGAHIGVFTFFVLQHGCTVVAVEPCALNASLLERNLKAIARGGGVLVDRRAVSTKATTVPFFRHPSISFRHTTEPPRRPSVQFDESRVEAVTLQHLLDQHDPDCVKLDIQGAERDAVLSVADWKNVKQLVLEYDFEYAPELSTFHDFVANLEVEFDVIVPDRLRKLQGSWEWFPAAHVVYAHRRAATRFARAPSPAEDAALVARGSAASDCWRDAGASSKQLEESEEGEIVWVFSPSWGWWPALAFSSLERLARVVNLPDLPESMYSARQDERVVIFFQSFDVQKCASARLRPFLQFWLPDGGTLIDRQSSARLRACRETAVAEAIAFQRGRARTHDETPSAMPTGLSAMATAVYRALFCKKEFFCFIEEWEDGSKKTLGELRSRVTASKLEEKYVGMRLYDEGTDANGEAYKEHRQIACVDWVNRVGYQVVTHLIDREEDPEFNEGYLINEALPPLIKAGKNPGVQLLFEPVLDTTPPAKKSKRANS